MRRTYILFFFIALSFIASSTFAQSGVKELAQRLLGDRAHQFDFQLTSQRGNDSFELSTSAEGKIRISGNSSRALCFGLNWYLKYYAFSHVAWMGSRVDEQGKLPLVYTPYRGTCSLSYSYYLNYCTFGYSTPFWSWKRWEKELDWMALNGINLPLAIVGTEAVWKNTLERIGYTQQEINRFIPGPAYLGWWLMGNMTEVGGPLSDQWYADRVELQQKILARMKELDMKPVLPGYYGMVPFDFQSKFPQSRLISQGEWAGGLQRPPYLDPQDPLFDKIADIYYEEQKKLFGTVEYQSGDPFHEGGIIQGIDLKKAGRIIYSAMKRANPKTVWVLQGWTETPKPAMLEALNEKEALVLDLSGDVVPQHYARNGWEKLPWVWGIINNFGGKTGVFGTLDSMIVVPRQIVAAQKSKLSGVGAIMEGIENNPVTYDLLFEIPWRKEAIDKFQWVTQYARRRYGISSPLIDEGWKHLLNSAYRTGVVYDGSPESVLCASPQKNIIKTSAWGATAISYDTRVFNKGVALFIEEALVHAGPLSDGFEYDLVDFTRQVLSNLFTETYGSLMKYVEANDSIGFRNQAQLMLSLADDIETLCYTRKEFLVGNWIEEALQCARTPSDRQLFQRNARAVLTTWTFSDTNLKDYAHREYAGMIRDYYKPRWLKFLSALEQEMKGKTFVQPNYYEMERNWVEADKGYATQPVGNAKEIVLRLYNKYKFYFHPQVYLGKKDFDLGASLPLINSYPQQAFNRMRQCGFAYIEALLTPMDSFDLDRKKAYVEKFRMNCRESGIRLWSVHIPYGNAFDPSVTEEAVWRKVEQNIFDYLELLRPLGKFPYVILHPSFEVIEDNQRAARLESLLRNLPKLAKEVQWRFGAKIALECLPRICLGNTSSELNRIISQIPEVSVCFDTNHLLQEDPVDGAYAFGNRIQSLHVSDFDGVDEKHWIPVQQSSPIDWTRFFRLLDKVDYQGPFLFEVGRNNYNDALDGYFEDMAKAYQLIRNTVE